MSYTEAQARALIIDACHRLMAERLVARTWGNLSARLEGDKFLITPSGRAYETLKEEDLVIVNLNDMSYEGNYKPSSEKRIHAAAYILRPEVNFVIHTHQFYASAVCSVGKHTPFAPCAGYGLPGTKKLAAAVEKVMDDYPEKDAFLMAKHGALAVGADCEAAFAAVNQLEADCKALFDATVFPTSGMSEVEISDSVSDGPAAVWHKDPLTMLVCEMGKPLLPYLDDFAQLIGVSAKVSSDDPCALVKALSGRNAVLVPGKGALCVAGSPDDAVATAQVLEKNCAAALYSRGKHPLNPVDAKLQRTVYLKQYSKQKDA